MTKALFFRTRAGHCPAIVSRLLVSVIFSLGAMAANGQQPLRVSPLFGDNACVQAGRPVNVWGWSVPGDNVDVTLGDSRGTVTAGADGKWQIQLSGIKPGGPYTLTISGSGGRLQSTNIVAGEVWLASGQSNMVYPLERTTEAAVDLPQAGIANLRLFLCTVKPDSATAQEPQGEWVESSPTTAGRFSGVAWYFGRRLNQELGVPVGIVQSSLGGTPIEAWLPPEVWRESPQLTDIFTARTAEVKTRLSALEKGQVPLTPAQATRPAAFVRKMQTSQIERNSPSECYDSGIAPLIPYTIAGIIWYQGEWNAPRADSYELLLKLLISKWRLLWGEGDIPFYLVQLPNQGHAPTAVVEQKSGWAAIREAQANTLTLPDTGMAVTIDLGSKLLHPPRKKPVGERLAGIVLANVYKRPVPGSGPVFAGEEAGGGKITLHFKHADGLRINGAAGSTGFAIAGSDRKFYPAEAGVEGDAVVVSSQSVPSPEQVRYLWANNPVATLYNGAGLPAGPFRTDTWDTVTAVPLPGDQERSPEPPPSE